MKHLIIISIAIMSLSGCKPKTPTYPARFTGDGSGLTNKEWGTKVITNDLSITWNTEPQTVTFEFGGVTIECATNYYPTNITTDGYQGTIQIGKNRFTVMQIDEALKGLKK